MEGEVWVLGEEEDEALAYGAGGAEDTCVLVRPVRKQVNERSSSVWRSSIVKLHVITLEAATGVITYRTSSLGMGQWLPLCLLLQLLLGIKRRK